MEPKTIEDVLALLEERPGDAELFQDLGRLYLEAGRMEESLLAYQRALALNPNDPWTHLYLGNWYFHEDRWGEALERFRQAAEMLPEEPIVYTCQGDVYLAQGRHDLAEQAYRKAVQAGPGNRLALQKLWDLEEQLGRGPMEPSRKQIRAAYRNGYAATVVLLAPRWLRDHPEDTGILLDYAGMLYHLTRYEEAIRVYEDVLGKCEAGRWAILVELGQLNRYRRNLPEAERWFQKAVETDPDHAAGYILLGAVQARQGKLESAEASHRAASRCRTGDIDEAYLNLGLVLRGQGKLAEAAEAFRKAIELTPDYGEALDGLEDVELALAWSARGEAVD